MVDMIRNNEAQVFVGYFPQFKQMCEDLTKRYEDFIRGTFEILNEIVSENVDGKTFAEKIKPFPSYQRYIMQKNFFKLYPNLERACQLCELELLKSALNLDANKKK